MDTEEQDNTLKVFAGETYDSSALNLSISLLDLHNKYAGQPHHLVRKLLKP